MTPITLQLIKKSAIYGMILLFSRLPLVPLKFYGKPPSLSVLVCTTKMFKFIPVPTRHIPQYPVFLPTGSISLKKHKFKNCYPGKGGDLILPNPYSNHLPIPDCTHACKIDDSCEGVVVDNRQSNRRCMKRKNIQPCDCKTDNRYILYTKPTGMQNNVDQLGEL